MKLYLRTRPAALFGAAVAIAAIALLPMRVALGILGVGETGLTARAVEGTVWSATLHDAAWGGIALGDVRARLSPAPLLLGRARIDLASAEGDTLHGAIIVSRHSLELDDAAASLAPGRIFDPLPVSRLDLSAVSVLLRDGLCVTASGDVRLGLDAGIAGLDVADLRGPLRCDAGALLVTLSGAGGTANATLRVEGDGRFRSLLTVQPLDADAGSKLALGGFRPGPRGYTLATEGRLRRP